MKTIRSFFVFMLGIIMISNILPVFAEVTELQTNSEESKIADFIDSSKNPQYYLDRYYNEPKYKSWFDKNYPEITIEQASGYTNNVEKVKTVVEELIDKNILPEAQAISVTEQTPQLENNSEIAQIMLAVGGLGILFGAVYGVKRKVDDNSRQISLNKDTIRRKIIKPLIGYNPIEIIQTRLAKGEISLEEYEILERKFNKFG